MAKLLERIPPDTEKDNCQRTAIEGLGGIGKTQIALEAVFRIHDKYPHCSVFWVPVVDTTGFENAYRNIGRELEIEGINDNKADIKSLIKTALSRDEAGSWLLVVDNADDTDLLFGSADAGLCDYLPFSRKGSILFTTRDHKAAVRLTENSVVDVVSIEELERDEAVKLLQINLKEHQLRDAESNAKLLDFLADLPLAIKQASAYMAKEQISTKQYLELCQSSNQGMIDLLGRNFEDQHRYRHKNVKNPIATTWLISFDHIAGHDSLAADYLKFMCFLSEKDIPMILLPPAGKVKTTEAMGTLRAYAFVTERESSSFDMHRLVRLAMRNWLDENASERGKCITRVIRRLADVFPWPKHENKEIWRKYLPHAQAAIEYHEYAMVKAAGCRLLSGMGESYFLLGKYREAELMWRQTLELWRKIGGAEHPDTLRSMNNLANVLCSLGRYNEAEPMWRQTIELWRKIDGAEHPDTLRSMNNLASVLCSLGRYNEAKPIYQQTLELWRKIGGAKHPDTLRSINNLANVLCSLGRYNKAEPMCRLAIKLWRKICGAEHPDTLRSMNNLANVLCRLGRYNEAELMYQQTLELRRKIYGAEHPDTLRSMNNLAIVLCRLGRYNEAEPMCRQTLELMQKICGAEHPDSLISMNNLAIVLRSLGRFDEAEQIRGFQV